MVVYIDIPNIVTTILVVAAIKAAINLVKQIISAVSKNVRSILAGRVFYRYSALYEYYQKILHWRQLKLLEKQYKPILRAKFILWCKRRYWRFKHQIKIRLYRNIIINFFIFKFKVILRIPAFLRRPLMRALVFYSFIYLWTYRKLFSLFVFIKYWVIFVWGKIFFVFFFFYTQLHPLFIFYAVLIHNTAAYCGSLIAVYTYQLTLYLWYLSLI